MHRDKTAAFHADGTDFPGFSGHVRFNPDTGSPLQAFALDSVKCQKADNHLFQQVDILLQSQMPEVKVKNRITGNLSRPVISNVASPIDMEIFNARLLQIRLRDQQIRLFPALAQRQHRIMFAKKQCIDTLLARSLCPQQSLESLRLHLQCLRIIYPSQIFINNFTHRLLISMNEKRM